MCGICGIVSYGKDRLVNQKIMKDMVTLIDHRGPDDEGIYLGWEMQPGAFRLGLGNRRLSIIDLSPKGHQPMCNEKETIWVSYNGEIYNFREIKEQLEQKGHAFKSHTDTEVIIHAYEEWGTESIKRYIGMFAFMLWDSEREYVWVVRDRLGIKPVYYYWDNETFVCSSEIKPILKTGVVKYAINEKTLDSYFTLGYVPSPETLFSRIRKLKAGHFIELENGTLREKEYWDFSNVEPAHMDIAAAEEKIRELITDSINKRLLSDVPLGVFLSGGIDSSAVVALMSDLVTGPIDTFTVSYDKKYKVGEDPYADLVSRQYKTRHHVFRLEPDDFFSSIESLVHFAEEPIVESAAIALYHISKLARQKVIVLLSGEGGDEVFGGYHLYQFMKKISSYQRFMPFGAKNIFKAIAPLAPYMKYRKYLEWLSLPLEKRYMGTSGYLTESLKREFYRKDYFERKGDYAENTFASYFGRVSHTRDIINAMLYVDTKTWLVDDLLLKADKMTMAASIELRVPFLDHRLVELSASLPSTYKIRNGEGKFILKKIMESRLPKEIVYRKKMGFPVPTAQWMKDDLKDKVQETVLDRNSITRDYFDSGRISRMIKDNTEGKDDYNRILLTLLILEIWNNHYKNFSH
jgi:asparagine synthase (glutamine-hydrolysing)